MDFHGKAPFHGGVDACGLVGGEDDHASCFFNLNEERPGQKGALLEHIVGFVEENKTPQKGRFPEGLNHDRLRFPTELRIVQIHGDQRPAEMMRQRPGHHRFSCAGRPLEKEGQCRAVFQKFIQPGPFTPFFPAEIPGNVVNERFFHVRGHDDGFQINGASLDVDLVMGAVVQVLVADDIADMALVDGYGFIHDMRTSAFIIALEENNLAGNQRRASAEMPFFLQLLHVVLTEDEKHDADDNAAGVII